MNELLNLKLSPNKPRENNQDLFEFIERLSKDDELFKRFITELVDKYTKMLDQKIDLQNSKIDRLNRRLSVNLEYLEDEEGLKLGTEVIDE